MDAFQLVEPTKGDPYAYACGRCHCVHVTGYRIGPPTVEILNARRAAAEKCCTCHECGKPMERAGSIGFCGVTCADIAYAREPLPDDFDDDGDEP